MNAISVIIPCTEEFRALKESVDHLLLADNNNYICEILIIVPPSLFHNTARKCLESDGRGVVKVLEVENNTRNAATPRNAGIACAEGDMLFFIDSGVNVGKNCFAVLSDFCRQQTNDADIAIGRVDTIAGKNRFGCDIRSSWLDESATHTWPWRMFWSSLLFGPKHVFKRNFSECFKGWGCEDLELGYRLVNEGYNYEYLGDLKGLHNIGKSPRNPYIRYARGLQYSFSDYADNICRFILMHGDLSISDYFAEVEFPWLILDSYNVIRITDCPRGNGYRILNSILLNYIKKYQIC